MLTRRALTKFLGAAALSGGLPFGLAAKAIAQIAAPPTPRGTYLIKNGAVVTVDEILGTLPRADVLVRDGRIAGGRARFGRGGR
jgi:5-methylthioadenosine/S-adenosylhomocysteine deaminase